MNCDIISISRGNITSMSTARRPADFYAFQGLNGWIVIKRHPLPDDVLTLGELLDQYGDVFHEV
jgi:hypothetical protein